MVNFVKAVLAIDNGPSAILATIREGISGKYCFSFPKKEAGSVRYPKVEADIPNFGRQFKLVQQELS